MMSTLKEKIKSIPILGTLARQLHRRMTGNQTKAQPFPGSNKYWENRYASGGNSGTGSYDNFAAFKAEIINSFVTAHNVTSVIEFGCGDGNQLNLMNYPHYLGLDVSETVLSLCKQNFASDETKVFKTMQEYEGENAELSLSLDVLYHLIEDDVYDNYMMALFKAAKRYVIIYSSNSDDNKGYEGTHVKHRKFTQWIEDNTTDWKLNQHIPNKYPYQGNYKTGSFADFYLYEKA
jgi:SAM-dependent methyltransferase